jgi:lipopolysaccharide export system permease protein
LTRLGAYLTRLFVVEAAALFGIALTIIYLSQTLRIVDIGAVRDRGFATVLWQTVLALPPLSIAFMYLCIAIGLARVLRALQGSRELHIIHVSGQLGTLLRAILGYALVGMMVVMLLSHFVSPWSKSTSNLIQAQAAADLVGRSLVPNRFASLGRGVTVTVGGRGPRGEITSFFADDRRDEGTRRTYIADSAVITLDEVGHVLQLQNGTIQYLTAAGQFSEISFIRYDIPLERLTGDMDARVRRGDAMTPDLIARAFSEGEWPRETLSALSERTADGLRVLALCLFVAAVCAFPSGRRRDPRLPIEIWVLVVLLLERGLTSYLPLPDHYRHLAGVALLIPISLAILAQRLRVFSPTPRGAPA